jgi:hypothetical protein
VEFGHIQLVCHRWCFPESNLKLLAFDQLLGMGRFTSRRAVRVHASSAVFTRSTRTDTRNQDMIALLESAD